MASSASSLLDSGRVPSPSRAALPLFAPAAAAVALMLAPAVPAAAAGAVALAFASAGLLRALAAYRERSRLRQFADRAILQDVVPGRRSPLVRWRCAELTAPAARVRTARSVSRLVRELESPTLPGASPVNRIAARESLHLLRQLADRLSALERPVEARGVLQASWLLVDGASPLYDRGEAHSLPRALSRALAALEA